MNKINNQFTSIEQITDRYLGTGKGNSTVNASGLSFEEILKQKQDVSESLVIVDSLAFIVNVPNKTVVTAMDRTESDDNIYTNIDGAVII